MPPKSKPGSVSEWFCASSFWSDPWGTGSEISQGSSMGQIPSSDWLFTTSGSGDSVTAGAKDDDPYYNCGIVMGEGGCSLQFTQTN